MQMYLIIIGSGGKIWNKKSGSKTSALQLCLKPYAGWVCVALFFSWIRALLPLRSLW
jgi:hypothetical protein